MCAIAGWASTVPQPAQRIMEMLDAQSHRGPDGAGIRQCGAQGQAHRSGDEARRMFVMLGHRRLAMVDPSAAGSQPMTSRDGRFSLVLNGEIFNYSELRRRLEGPFRSATDTEVLVEACAAWGVERALEECTGMFAFALWDARDGRLTLARDRMGEKPLVYFDDGVTLAFSSELKALAGFHDRRLDPWATDAYLALGYIPAPLAIFKGCRKLEAGHLLEYRPGSGPRVRRWWFPEAAAAPCNGSYGERLAALREHTGQAVRSRLGTDMAAALCLSGGLDSAVIAAECARSGSRPEAFTVRIADEPASGAEVALAGLTAQSCGLRHNVIDTTPPASGAEIETLVRHYDEPFADSSAWPSLALGKALAGRYKLVLNGDGGDEAFGGYKHYRRIAWKQAGKALAAAAGFRDGFRSGRAGIYVQSKALFRAADRARLLNGHAAGNALAAWIASSERAGSSGTVLKQALSSDRRLQLANALTYKTDIAFAAFGIEVRAPFLDHRLVQWAEGLPESDLVRGRRTKHVLREAYRGLLPEPVLEGNKQGFGAPIERWLKGPLRDWAAGVLSCPLLDTRQQMDCQGQRLWALGVFSQWARQWRAAW